MNVNDSYKASVFSMLFSDPDVLRELYGALEGVTLPPDIPVTINTLENVLFMEFYNDISFMLGDKLVVLIEHQSTINPNMALRLLMYIARVYEKIIDDKKIYSSKLLPIPRPEFFVLYNGKENYPDEQIIKLSDSFMKSDLPEKLLPALELEVKVININEGRNEAIARRCRKLAEYNAFIAKVRFFEKETGNKEEAMKKAIDYCRNHDILKEFLEEHSKEAFNMLMTEWNMEDALAYTREEAWDTATETIAQNALNEGLPMEVIQKITGLDTETIQRLRPQE